MPNEYDRMTLQDMIWQLTMNTKFTEEALIKMPTEKILELYRVKVLGEE